MFQEITLTYILICAAINGMYHINVLLGNMNQKGIVVILLTRLIPAHFVLVPYQGLDFNRFPPPMKLTATI
jgi:glycosyltransferase A (GT-A) superfamily protein (DUF2064 family)